MLHVYYVLWLCTGDLGCWESHQPMTTVYEVSGSLQHQMDVCRLLNVRPPDDTVKQRQACVLEPWRGNYSINSAGRIVRP